MATWHLAITASFWVLWLIVVVVGSRYVAAAWPGAGNVLGFVGTLLLFLPSASVLAWDVASRFGRAPRDAQGTPLPPSDGYSAFSWGKVLAHAVGITFIGLGFAVSHFARSG